jgi:hypothetical protein
VCARDCRAYDWLDAYSDFEIAARFAGFLITGLGRCPAPVMIDTFFMGFLLD